MFFPKNALHAQLLRLSICSTALCVTPVFAQTPATPVAVPVDPVKLKLEQEAEELFQQGESRMKVASYDDAIVEFRNVLKRYPDTQVRYKAQFRIADALVEQKKEADAQTLLQTVVKEESAEWSPKALAQLGDIYGAQQKYSEAFRSYRQIITDYPDSPTVDRAYFAIGSTHFRLGHFELAVQELEKVGTAYASRVASLQRVSPGEPLQVRVTEPNLVANAAMTLPVTITASSGDREAVNLRADVEGGDRFRATISTRLGTATPGNGILELHGSDKVALTYKARYTGGTAADKKVTMDIASNARLVVLDSAGNEVRGVVVSDTMSVQIGDADRDLSAAKDTIEVLLTTRKKDSEKIVLTETDIHSGIFRAAVKTAQGASTPNSGALETNAGFAEGSATQYDDAAIVTYQDEINLLPTAAQGTHKVTTTVSLYAATEGSASVVGPQIPKRELEIQALLYKGRSLNEIASTYRDLGQEAKSTLTFTKAETQFQDIITKYPNSSEVEDALYGLFQTYVGQDQYESAIAVVTRITQRFPNSARGPQALFELASVHIKREEYGRALGIYQSLVQRAQGTPLAEDAQYAIATTYLAMLKPKAGDTDPPPVTREQVAVAFEEFARNYVNSERTPEALWQLVRFRTEGEDYKGAVDVARRMVATYPDNVMTGRVLLLQGQAQYKLRDLQGARDTFRGIIANYGAEADQAQKLLTEIEKRLAPKTPVATTTATTTAATP